MISPRQAQIIRILVDEYVSSAEPVSSQWIASHLRDGVSSATVRNDFLSLEDIGILEQPHTSAGRIPTERGYRYYIDNCVDHTVAHISNDNIRGALQRRTALEEKIRTAARELASATCELVLIETQNATFATGLSNLFSQPEAEDGKCIMRISTALDRSENILQELDDYAGDGDEIKVFVGRENPLNSECALILTRVKGANAHDEDRLIGILGFMRMEYERNIAFLSRAKQLLESIL